MENASKALIMAGGVLIGVLIISLAVYLFIDFGSTSAEINAQNAKKQLAEFNSKFTSYEGYKDKDENWQITIYNIITLAGFAKENNAYYGETSREKIDVKIGNSIINNQSEEYLIAQYVGTNGTITKFQYDGVTYNDYGRVNSIKFKAI